MANDDGPRGLLTLVCLTCGNEKFYDKAVPNAVICEKCGGTVFRNFATPTEPDDASIAHRSKNRRAASATAIRRPTRRLATYAISTRAEQFGVRGA